MTTPIKDAASSHWVYKAPAALRPYLQLARYDRPVGYWLLTLPGWMGLAFASLSHGFATSDLKWAALILIGAIAMRGAGCTYNDIVDRDLDAQVDRTALRPIPAGTVSVKQAWIWLALQCVVGLLVLLCLPRLAQIISLCSIPLVAAYPFMKRITWWPQVWLGLTFNWAVLVAYAIKTGTINPPILVLYVGLIFWTIGYDTIYACQDIEDDMKIGVKSTARRFGEQVELGVAICYLVFAGFVFLAVATSGTYTQFSCGDFIFDNWAWGQKPVVNWKAVLLIDIWAVVPLLFHLLGQLIKFDGDEASESLTIFKSNFWAGLVLVLGIVCLTWVNSYIVPHSDQFPCMESYSEGAEVQTQKKRYIPITQP